MNANIRNIGIIAHVDHGKTTLVDKLLQVGGDLHGEEATTERLMDSMDLERERGITIRAKNASIEWNGITINIVDTPGHADFGGEVERILKMVDGVLLLVDAADGPQAQTRFVLKKAIEQGLHVIVVLNKIDRPHANPTKVHDQVLELLMELHANEHQFHAPFVYASAKEGFALREPTDPHGGNMDPLLEAIVKHIPPPQADPNGPFKMVVSNIDWSDYLGRIVIGKILGGSVKVGDPLYCIHKSGKRERAAVTQVTTFRGVGTSESAVGQAGAIVGIAGFEDAYLGETICDSEKAEPEPIDEVDPPTISMQFGVNDSPLGGREGKFLTARHIRERLVRETRTNISIEVADSDQGGFYTVSARGALQIAILVETMRREGFELLVSRPEVIVREEGGKKLEPYETLWIDLPQENLGDMLQFLASRKGQITKMEHHPTGVQVEAVITTRGLIGLETALANLTGGRAVISHMFKEYGPICGDIRTRGTGVLVSMEKGSCTAYALNTLQERGWMFVGPTDATYEGMIVGENSRGEDLPCNPTKPKKLSNMRASGTDEAIILEPPIRMSLEKAIEYVAADEFIEITPSVIRLRKKILQENMRKRNERAQG